MKLIRLAVLVCVALVWCAPVALAQDAKRWTFHETVDDFTDQRSRHIFAQDPTGKMTLVVSATDDKPSVAILIPGLEFTGTLRVTVEYRVDQNAVVTEQWIFSKTMMFSESPGLTIRRLQTGSRLRLRIRFGAKEGPTMEFDIRGLDEALPQLKLPVVRNYPSNGS